MEGPMDTSYRVDMLRSQTQTHTRWQTHMQSEKRTHTHGKHLTLALHQHAQQHPRNKAQPFQHYYKRKATEKKNLTMTTTYRCVFVLRLHYIRTFGSVGIKKNERIEQKSLRLFIYGQKK